MAIGRDADMNVLNMFIEGCENPVLFAEDAEDIVNRFKQITMTITTKITSPDPNKPVKVSNEPMKFSNQLDREEADDDLDDFEF